MKKLMIAAAIVCAAAMSQASSVIWNQNSTQIDGDFESGEGQIAPDGWQMYLFDSNKAEGGTSYLQMQTLLAAATTEAGYADWLTAMGTKATVGTITDTLIAVSGVEMTEVDNSFKGYAVLIDAENIGDAKYAFLVGEETFTKGASATTISFGTDYDVPGGFFIDARDYSADPKTGWTAVGAAPIPEPTSGLLLLLGVAGLALRRRRA